MDSNLIAISLQQADPGGLLDRLGLLVEVVFSMFLRFTRVMIFLLPSPFSDLVCNPFSCPAGADALGVSQRLTVKSGSTDSIVVQSLPQGAGPIGRSLFQVLALVNEIPASSNKYEFAKALADRIVTDNQQHGGYLHDVNRAALSAGFTRTVKFLARSLSCSQRRQRGSQGWGWLWCWIPLLNAGPGKLFLLPAPLSVIVARLLSLCQYVLLGQVGGYPGQKTAETMSASLDFAEKLSQELVWLSKKMVDNFAAHDAIVQWSSASSLAMLSLTASPRVKRSLVKVSVFLCKGLLREEVKLPKDAKANILLLWLPLLCNATHGGDGSLFSSGEKLVHERMLGELVRSLPPAEQEEVLSLWLHEFALSASDWPNLLVCYENWCHASRKLGLPGKPTRHITFDTKRLAIVRA